MSRPKYVASCSGGKDSVATLLLAAQHNEPLDEAVFSEVMFDKDTSGEVPEHRDFIYDRLKPFCEKELGIKFTILHADKTYDDVFHHINQPFGRFASAQIGMKVCRQTTAFLVKFVLGRVHTTAHGEVSCRLHQKLKPVCQSVPESPIQAQISGVSSPYTKDCFNTC